MNDTPTTSDFRDRLHQARDAVRACLESGVPGPVLDQSEVVRHRIDRTMRRVEREMRRGSHRVRRTAGDLAFDVSERREQLKEGVEDLTWQAGRWMRARPARALLTAFAVGFVAGLLVPKGGCCSDGSGSC